MIEFLNDQKQFIASTVMYLKEIDVSFIQLKQEGKWSVKEIVGHLIDSASNNHQRFIRAQFKDDLIFDGYDQNKWVAVQNYYSADWNLLIDCWMNFNLVIINSVINIPNEIMSAERNVHNLDSIAWKQVPVNESVTLDYFIKDYYGHMHHHINQIKRLINSLQNES